MEGFDLSTLDLPVALLVLAVAALWRRTTTSDARTQAEHRERIVRLELKVDECDKDRYALRAALNDHVRKCRPSTGPPASV